MSTLDTMVYIFSVSIALLTLRLGYYLLKTYRIKFLSSYFYFLVGYNLLGFVLNLGISMAFGFVSPQNAQSVINVTALLCLMGYPLFPYAIYMFIKTLVGMVEKELSSLLRYLYFSFWGAIFFLLLIGINQILNAGKPVFFIAVIWLGTILGNLFLIGAIFYLILRAKHMKERVKIQAFKIFASLYLFCFFIDFAVYIIIFNKLDLLQLENPLVYFSKNLPPLLYLIHFLKKYHREVSLTPEEKEGLENFFHMHNVSPREQEIIRLIVEGKTNREIEDTLYISLQTVKNSITAIYKKMKVKNRIQLINLVRNQKKFGPMDDEA